MHSYQNCGSGAKPPSPGLDKDVQRTSGTAQKAAAMVPFYRALVEVACEGGHRNATMEKTSLVKSVTKLVLVLFRFNFHPNYFLVKQPIVWLRQCFSVVFNLIQHQQSCKNCNPATARVWGNPICWGGNSKRDKIAERLPPTRPTAWCSLCASSKCTSLTLCDLLKRDLKRKLMLSIAPDTNCVQPQFT